MPGGSRSHAKQWPCCDVARGMCARRRAGDISARRQRAGDIALGLLVLLLALLFCEVSCGRDVGVADSAQEQSEGSHNRRTPMTAQTNGGGGRRRLQSVSPLASHVSGPGAAGTIVAGTQQWIAVELRDGSGQPVTTIAVSATDFTVRSDLPVCQSKLSAASCPWLYIDMMFLLQHFLAICGECSRG